VLGIKPDGEKVLGIESGFLVDQIDEFRTKLEKEISRLSKINAIIATAVFYTSSNFPGFIEPPQYRGFKSDNVRSKLVQIREYLTTKANEDSETNEDSEANQASLRKAALKLVDIFRAIEHVVAGELDEAEEVLRIKPVGEEVLGVKPRGFVG
jgi:hypothetical protein